MLWKLKQRMSPARSTGNAVHQVPTAVTMKTKDMLIASDLETKSDDVQMKRSEFITHRRQGQAVQQFAEPSWIPIAMLVPLERVLGSHVTRDKLFPSTHSWNLLAHHSEHELSQQQLLMATQQHVKPASCSFTSHCTCLHFDDTHCVQTKCALTEQQLMTQHSFICHATKETNVHTQSWPRLKKPLQKFTCQWSWTDKLHLTSSLESQPKTKLKMQTIHASMFT